jgi:hypothetical protein
MLHAKQQLLEEIFRGLLARAAVDLDAIEQLATVRELHHQEYRTFRLLTELQDAVEVYYVSVMNNFPHVLDLAKNPPSPSHKLRKFRRNQRHIRFRAII